MADPRAFISFDCAHNDGDKTLFVRQSKNSKTPFTIQDWSARSTLPQSEWEAIVRDKINACNILIVLVGKQTAGVYSVVQEIGMAKDQDVPVFGIYVGRANANSDLPVRLPRNRTIKWDWNQIAAAIQQMMTEGKNS